MVRYIDENKVLLNNYGNFDESLREKLISVLQTKFEIKELHYEVEHQDKNNWAYINYLRIGDLILLPALGIEEDKQAFAQFSKLFPNAHLEQVNVLDIVKKDGALNCISWNVKANDGILKYLDTINFSVK
jgi:agmatine/peptidylarginine deiminase